MISWSTRNLHNLWTRNFTETPKHLRNSILSSPKNACHPCRPCLTAKILPVTHLYLQTWWCPSNFPQRWPNWNIMALYHATKNLKKNRCSISTDLEATLTRCALCWKLTQEEDDKEISQGQYHRGPTLLPQPFSTETILWVHSWSWL